MKIQVSEFRLIRHGHLVPLWDVLEWMDQSFAPGYCFIYPKMGLRGVLKPPEGLSPLEGASWMLNKNVATGRLDGRDKHRPLMVDTPPEKKRDGLRVFYVPKGFREEPRAIVETPDGLWITAHVFVGESLELSAFERLDPPG